MIGEIVVGSGLVAAGLGIYAFGIEPFLTPKVRTYRVHSERLSYFKHRNGRGLRIAALADLHASRIWMTSDRIKKIVAQTNALKPDVIVLLGDFVSGFELARWTELPAPAWCAPLSRLSAPLGTFAVLGNHDCWRGGEIIRDSLEKAGIPVLHNVAARFRTEAGARFWLAGLGAQHARKLGRGRFEGQDDLDGTMEQIDGGMDPVILLAHEPDIFPQVPDRVDLTLSGHTHGGQVRFPLVGAPYVPSRYGQRYAYGHRQESGRQLIVSGGLGCTGLPLRFGVAPEIVLVEAG